MGSQCGDIQILYTHLTHVGLRWEIRVCELVHRQQQEKTNPVPNPVLLGSPCVSSLINFYIVYIFLCLFLFGSILRPTAHDEQVFGRVLTTNWHAFVSLASPNYSVGQFADIIAYDDDDNANDDDVFHDNDNQHADDNNNYIICLPWRFSVRQHMYYRRSILAGQCQQSRLDLIL